MYSFSQLPLNTWGNKAKALTYIATLICLPLSIICSGAVFLVALNIEAGKKIKDNCSNRLIPTTLSSEEDQELLSTISSWEDTRSSIDDNSETKHTSLSMEDKPKEIQSETQVFIPIKDTSIKSTSTSSDDQHSESETAIDFDFKLDSEPSHYPALYTPKKAYLNPQMPKTNTTYLSKLEYVPSLN